VQDLNDLQYFAEVVRHGGFSAASRATGEPKSKLGKRVAQLEQGLRRSPHRALDPQSSKSGAMSPAMKFTGACA
jgi:hypothetical protein